MRAAIFKMNRFLSVFLSHTMFRLWKYVKDPCSRKSILSETPGFSFRLFKISIKFYRIWDGNGQFGWISNGWKCMKETVYLIRWIVITHIEDSIIGALSSLKLHLATECPLKMMKKIFISSYKLFSFSRYLSFWHDFLVIMTTSKQLD